eukprot:TRINITY_DN5420_c0_g1_i2.p1 TRINITY_DN5420_c0_g1~~TRINITY_DN5420_c0_g1_i2.p1  ORF type:complete len:145 (-),score=2.99 TRINITY_DN5420_c0_g1_i2:29-463(-)
MPRATRSAAPSACRTRRPCQRTHDEALDGVQRGGGPRPSSLSLQLRFNFNFNVTSLLRRPLRDALLRGARAARWAWRTRRPCHFHLHLHPNLTSTSLLCCDAPCDALCSPLGVQDTTAVSANPMYSALIPVSYTHLTLPTIYSV